MLKRITHIVLSVLLGVLLVFSTTPKEYIHLFAGHQDTVHHEHDDDVTHFDPEHHHCQFLELSLPPFIGNDVSFSFPSHVVEYAQYYTSLEGRLMEKIVSVRYLRGPPHVLV